MHAEAPVPHAVSFVPSTQLPLVSQQPVHAALHADPLSEVEVPRPFEPPEDPLLPDELPEEDVLPNPSTVPVSLPPLHPMRPSTPAIANPRVSIRIRITSALAPAVRALRVAERMSCARGSVPQPEPSQAGARPDRHRGPRLLLAADSRTRIKLEQLR
jgi:hypothetical protein